MTRFSTIDYAPTRRLLMRVLIATAALMLLVAPASAQSWLSLLGRPSKDIVSSLGDQAYCGIWYKTTFYLPSTPIDLKMTPSSSLQSPTGARLTVGDPIESDAVYRQACDVGKDIKVLLDFGKQGVFEIAILRHGCFRECTLAAPTDEAMLAQLPLKDAILLSPLEKTTIEGRNKLRQMKAEIISGPMAPLMDWDFDWGTNVRLKENSEPEVYAIVGRDGSRAITTLYAGVSLKGRFVLRQTFTDIGLKETAYRAYWSDVERAVEEANAASQKREKTKDLFNSVR